MIDEGAMLVPADVSDVAYGVGQAIAYAMMCVVALGLIGVLLVALAGRGLWRDWRGGRRRRG